MPVNTLQTNLLSHRIENCGNLVEDGKVQITSHQLKEYLENEPPTYGQLVSLVCLGGWLSPAIPDGCEAFKDIQ